MSGWTAGAIPDWTPRPGDGLVLKQRTDHFGMPYTEVMASVKHSLASVGYTVVATMLGAVLRKALNDHLDEHGCGTPGHPNYTSGFWHCPEAKRLWDLLPEGDRIVLA